MSPGFVRSIVDQAKGLPRAPFTVHRCVEHNHLFKRLPRPVCTRHGGGERRSIWAILRIFRGRQRARPFSRPSPSPFVPSHRRGDYHLQAPRGPGMVLSAHTNTVVPDSRLAPALTPACTSDTSSPETSNVSVALPNWWLACRRDFSRLAVHVFQQMDSSLAAPLRGHHLRVPPPPRGVGLLDSQDSAR